MTYEATGPHPSASLAIGIIIMDLLLLHVVFFQKLFMMFSLDCHKYAREIAFDTVISFL